MSGQRDTDWSWIMRRLPPLEALRFFEAAARHGSFAAAGEELCVTSAAVAHRVRTLESSLREKVFVRHPRRGVELNRHGEALLRDVQRILTELYDVAERLRSGGEAPRLKILAAEGVAAMWLLSRLPDFKANHPCLAIEVDTDHREIDPERREFDVWIVFASEVEAALQSETLFEEALVPVCSPALLEQRGRPRRPDDLRTWPLLYELEWKSHWAYWFSHLGAPPPDLSGAMGFRLHSMMIDAAIGSLGVALGHAYMIAPELDRGTLVSLFDEYVAAPARYHVFTAPASRDKPAARAFRDWILDQASPMRERARTIAIATCESPPCSPLSGR